MDKIYYKHIVAGGSACLVTLIGSESEPLFYR